MVHAYLLRVLLATGAAAAFAAASAQGKGAPIPLACDMTALTAEDRARHSELVQKLEVGRKSLKELPNGFELTYAGARKHWKPIAEWADLESRCCPFLTISLTVSGAKDLVTVRITGPKGVKEFLRLELGKLVAARATKN